MQPTGISEICRAATLIEVLRIRAEQHPKKTAVRFLADGENETGSLTYESLDKKARAFAATISKRVEAGERAVLIMEPGLDFIIAFFGCLYSKVIAVPAYPPKFNRKFERIEAILRDSGAKLVVATRKTIDQMNAEAGLADYFESIDWFAGDEFNESSAEEWQDFGTQATDVAFLQYTSGSTGDPKGVILTHANLMANLASIKRGFGFRSDSVMVSWLPLFHDMGLIGNLLEPIYSGCLTVIMPPAAFLERPLRWLEAITNYRGTIAGAPNFAYGLCNRRVTAGDLSKLNLSSIEIIYCGAEPIRPSTIEHFEQTFSKCGLLPSAIFPCYGLAEATLYVTGGPHGAPPTLQSFSSSKLSMGRAVPSLPTDESCRYVSSGQTAPGTSIRIIDPDSLLPMPERGIGEIWVHGPSVAKGYWNKGDTTADIFGAEIHGDPTRTKYLRTGDLGFFHGEGLFLVGRLKDVMIIGGMKFHPQDLELTAEKADRALRPGGCAVFSWDTGETEQIGLVAEIERSRLGEDLETICNRIVIAIAENHHLTLSRVLFLRPGSILKTSSGKLQRSLIRSALFDDLFQPVFSFQSPKFKQPINVMESPRFKERP